MRIESVPQVLDFDPYEVRATETDATHHIGEKVIAADRIFRYAKAGEALAAGYMTTEPTGNTSLTTMAVITGALGADNINFTNAATTTTAGYFDEGYVCVSYGTGIGQTYKVKSLAALVSGASSYVYLFDKIKVALDTTSKIDIVANPWNRVLHTATATLHPTGVPLVAVTAAGDFAWLQTRGVCAVFSDGTVPAGGSAESDGNVAGAIDAMAEADFVVNPKLGVGYHIAGAQNYAHPFFLTID
jgi:hypothetical protein